MTSIQDIENKCTIWFAFAEKLLPLGYEIIQEAKIPATDKQFGDPKILVLALLCRTISNFEGVVALLKLVLTRCCVENSFFIGALIEKCDEFVSAMYKDELASIRSGCKSLMETHDRSKETNETHKKFGKGLRERFEAIKKRWPQAKFLNPKEAAKSSVLLSAAD
jgi:hypothetical protein